MDKEVTVVIGAGGIGRAAARRVGSTGTVLLADHDLAAMEPIAVAMRGEGQAVTTHVVDVTSLDSVRELAEAAAELGRVTNLVHTAGVSAARSDVPTILAVNVLGVAHTLDAFAEVIAPGGAGVVIASNAGSRYADLDAEEARTLAIQPVAELAANDLMTPDSFPNASLAYRFSKRVTQLRVRAAAMSWGRRGARVNSISPGVVSTPMGRAELGGHNGPMTEQLIGQSPLGRIGATEDIAMAIEFLLGPSARFITGADLVVDGGADAAILAGAVNIGIAAAPADGK